MVVVVVLVVVDKELLVVSDNLDVFVVVGVAVEKRRASL